MSEKVIKPLRPAAKQTLFFADGFFFGCGFWVAGFIFFVVVIPVGTILIAMMLAMLGIAIGGQ